ncbi:MAG: hypothetical protein LOX98_11845 [Lysobacter sp.]|jgi:hypothetical protein|nr:hypothetical protein [Lysobacter sp.]MDV5982094.1 hypothetical protein [Lysobacter sp.]
MLDIPPLLRATPDRGPVHLPDEYDPDDNFAHARDAGAWGEDADDASAEGESDAGIEALAWQLLLLANPGDEDAALQQFRVFQEAWVEAGADESDVADLLHDASDWRSGFEIAETDAAGMVQALDELAARWSLRIDWGVEDPTDEAFLAAAEVPGLLDTAFDRLREYGYTVWVRETDGGYAGWITLSRDDEGMRMLSAALGLDLRPAGA